MLRNRSFKLLGWLVALAVAASVATTGSCTGCFGLQRREPPLQGEPSEPQTDENGRPLKWAQPLDLPGCGNLFKVSDGLYRGAQPSAEGMKRLDELGIKTVVNLRSFHSDRDEMGDLDFNYEHIYMKAWHPEEKEVIRFLRIVSDEANEPVFVHCQHGSDRTGTMCAIYRVAVQGWTKEDAIDEMTQGGYGFHPVWQNLIDYINGLDIEAIMVKAGMEPAAP